MKQLLMILLGCFALSAMAGPLEEKKAQAHIQAIAAGDVEAILAEYPDDAYLDWIGGPLDGRYQGKDALREVWTKFVALNEGKPRQVRSGKLVQQANPKGATLETGAEYAGKTTVKVWHVMVYRDGALATEIWQISPSLKLNE